MESDRELLELAANAAGYLFGALNAPVNDGKNQFYIWESKDSKFSEFWNPLTDDGDALRLAVNLNLRVLYHPALKQATVRPYFAAEREQESVENVEAHRDPCAATRCAIVRAAAEIGKAMK